MIKRRLLVDIETSMCEGRFWRPGYKINLSFNNVKRHAEIICICWKWEGEKVIHGLKWNYKAKERDKAMLKKFSKVFNQAHEIVAHNGDSFDIPWIKTQLIKYGLPPLPKVKTLDSLLLSRSNFRFPSNTLNDISKFLGGGGKMRCPFETWDRVMDGSTIALNKMFKYCKRDVDELEFVWNKIYVHIPQVYNYKTLELLGSKCINCGTKLKLNGTYKTNVGLKQRYKCTGCYIPGYNSCLPPKPKKKK